MAVLLAGMGAAALAAPGTHDLGACLRDYALRPATVTAVDPGLVVVTVELGARTEQLLLSPHSDRAPSFQMWTAGADGRLQPVAAPAEHTYRGAVAGVPGSRVAASIDGDQVQACVFDAGETWWIEPAQRHIAAASPADHLVYRQADVLPAPGVCGNDGAPALQAVTQDQTAVVAAATGGASPRNGPFTTCQIAFDADYEFFQLNGSNAANTASDIANVMNIVNTIYQYEVGIHHQQTGLIVRTDPSDPYTSTDPTTLLCEFTGYWNANVGIGRQVAHLMTGKELDGSTIGVAWIGAICEGPFNGCAGVGSYSYGLSESRYYSLLARRVVITAHELGHNWNALHCDGDADCGIMCSGNGGCAQDLYHFGQTPRNAISAFRDSRPCLPGAQSVPDDAFESNDNRYMAYPLTVGDYDLQLQDNQDYFSFTLCQAATLTLRVQHAFNMALTLDLRTPADCILATGASSYSDASKTITRFCQAGSYVINVRRTDGGPGGAYRLHFQLSAGDGSGAGCGPRKWYVRTSAPACGLGTSWSTAFTQVRDALLAARASAGVDQQIWVTAGTFTPDGIGGDRGQPFRLPAGVSIYGGFAGNEALITQRVLDPNTGRPVLATVLSGDLNGDDGPNFANYVDNSRHVVTMTSAGATTGLDGLTITGGNADVSGDTLGAGLLVVSGTPNIRRCTFRLNVARNGVQTEGGGGAVGLGSTDTGLPLAAPVFENCLFEQNESLGGGAIYCRATAQPEFRHCDFRANASAGASAGPGGALLHEAGSGMLTLEDCLLRDNIAPQAGAIWQTGSHSVLRRCVLLHNQATGAYPLGGGALLIQNDASSDVLACRFLGNSAAGDGGALRLAEGATLQARSTDFSGNSSGEHGGAVNLTNAAPLNVANFVNCTFTANNAANQHGGAVHVGSGVMSVTNSIVWGNVSDPNRAVFISAGTPPTSGTISYCDIEGASGSIPPIWGAGNIAVAPPFIDANGADDAPGTADDDLHLAPHSPCLDAGDPAFVPNPGEVDIDGDNRVRVCEVDIGADESTVFFDIDGDGVVDFDDFSLLTVCLAGRGVPGPGCGSEILGWSDTDQDGDIDLIDLAGFQAEFGRSCP